MSFRIRDAFLPTSEELLATLHGDDRLQGRVIDVTRDVCGRLFAVVEVEEAPGPIVVATAKLRRLAGAINPEDELPRPTPGRRER